MNRTLRAVIILLVFALTITACSPVSALMSVAPTTAPGSVLFQDDFADSSSGWSVLNQGEKIINYDNGGFRFLIGQANYDYWSTPRLSLENVRIDVDVAKNGGPDDNDFGIICRYQDENNFYGLLISSDGYYGISKMKGGEHRIIGAEGMQFSDAIHKGDTLNHLQAECNGSTLTLSVNGQKLIETHDSDFPAGDVGLVAGTFDQPGVDVTFDNFVVVKP